MLDLTIRHGGCLILSFLFLATAVRADFVINLIDALGARHQLGESLGRVTLVNFWATWCPPCVHEIPSMNRLAARYDVDVFAIVSINFREAPEHILQFMSKVDVDFPVLMDEDGAVSRDWGACSRSPVPLSSTAKVGFVIP